MNLSKLKPGDKFFIWSNPAIPFFKIDARVKLWEKTKIGHSMKYFYVSLLTHQLYAAGFDYKVIPITDENEIKRLTYQEGVTNASSLT
jgi:hypothetical protein